MDIILSYGSVLITVAAVFGFFMAWGIGANDVANAMGTSVGTKALTVKQAICIAMIFEFAGAYLAGGEVTATIRDGIVDVNEFVNQPEALVFGMMAALLSAGIWLILASYFGWPVSTTHSIIGAIVGFSVVSVGPQALRWSHFVGIVSSWIVTPFIAGALAYFLFQSLQKLIFNTPDPLRQAKKVVPVYVFLTVFIICMVTLKKGLKHIGLNLSSNDSILLSISISSLMAFLGHLFVRQQIYKPGYDQDMHYTNVEKIFGFLMVITACAMAFAHGSNDVANAIGPLSAVVSVVNNVGQVQGNTTMVWWILPLGAFGIVLGLAILGHRVMATVGTGITSLTPSRGFVAQLATASTVVIASGTGLPISTTQTLVGSIMGVGIARGIAALRLSVLRNIIISWIVTLPAGAILAVAIFYLIQFSFTGIK